MGATEEKIIDTLMDAMSRKTATEPYDTSATVRRIENGIAWVHINGGVDETPVKLTINAAVGDEVQVRVTGGHAFIVGNATSPPTDDRKAIAAQQTATSAAETAEAADATARSSYKAAEAAKKIADNTDQYFWHTETGTDTGAHITEIPKDDFLADPTNGGGNLLARSNGLALRNGLIELATLQQSGMDINTYDSQGRQINIAHLGYGDGNAQSGRAKAPYYTLGVRATGPGGANIGNYSVAEGDGNEASGYNSHAEGYASVASGPGSHAEGESCNATARAAHAEGDTCTASGEYSHAEGTATEARGDGSHVEGDGCFARGQYAHAEGIATKALETAAHAEGVSSEASQPFSHAQNYETKAAKFYQTAIGKYNEEDTTTNLDNLGYDMGAYALIIGNGTADNARSNAMTVGWNGDVEAAGDITDGSGNVLSAIAALLSGAVQYHYQRVLSTSVTISARGEMTAQTITADAIAGYTPVFVAPRNTGNASLHFRYCYLTTGSSKNNTINFALANPSANSVTVSNAWVNVLYVKTELVA